MNVTHYYRHPNIVLDEGGKGVQEISYGNV